MFERKRLAKVKMMSIKNIIIEGFQNILCIPLILCIPIS